MTDVVDALLEGVPESLGISVEVLPASEAEALRRTLQDRFTRQGSHALTMDDLVEYAKFTAVESWTAIGQFPHTAQVCVLSYQRDGKKVYRFTSARDALLVLGEAPPFDFFLCDVEGTFLFAHDEYDNLFGCGKAKGFVAALTTDDLQRLRSI